jgi:S-disulfanyl-L-cysteine oxidoreductase SoxD
MFMLDLKKSLLAVGVFSALILTSATAAEKKNIDGAVIYPVKDGMYTDYAVSGQEKKGFSSYGRKPTANEIKAWDTDVMPDGHGLPDGEGSVEFGDELYEAQCSMCHGDFGAGGVGGYPTLAGGQGTLKNQLGLEGTEGPRKTIGSYWPYASTLFWYIKTAMPFPHPKSLSDDEVYALTAYLLSVNGIKVAGEEMDDEFVLSKENFLDVQMNNTDGFYPVHPDRNDLKEQRGPLAQGVRCMKDCKQPSPVSINAEIDVGFDPAISTVKSLPKVQETATVSKASKAYEVSCSACHANAAIGAPVLGDKEAWAEVVKKGIDNVYANAINGINAMPPKGGADISDQELKDIVDYMINSSK